MKLDDKALARFWGKVHIGTEQECWLWTDHTTKGGYGQMWYDGGKVYAHRVSYELAHGTIPKGLELDHLCRVRACVNPAHLEAVTHVENVRRGQSASNLLSLRGECKRGHSLADAVRHVNGRVAYCRTCVREKRRSAA